MGAISAQERGNGPFESHLGNAEARHFQGDARIEEMLRARMYVVGITLSGAVNFMNPDILVLGGGLVDEMPKLVVQAVEEGLREYLVPEVGAVLKVRAAELGGEAVALGAAYVARERTTGL